MNIFNFGINNKIIFSQQDFQISTFYLYSRKLRHIQKVIVVVVIYVVVVVAVVVVDFVLVVDVARCYGLQALI